MRERKNVLMRTELKYYIPFGIHVLKERNGVGYKKLVARSGQSFQLSQNEYPVLQCSK